MRRCGHISMNYTYRYWAGEVNNWRNALRPWLNNSVLTVPCLINAKRYRAHSCTANMVVYKYCSSTLTLRSSSTIRQPAYEVDSLRAWWDQNVFICYLFSYLESMDFVHGKIATNIILYRKQRSWLAWPINDDDYIDGLAHELLTHWG